MKTLSLDLRERILISYDGGEGTREEIAERFRVSLGMVKKLLQQRRHPRETGRGHCVRPANGHPRGCQGLVGLVRL